LISTKIAIVPFTRLLVLLLPGAASTGRTIVESVVILLLVTSSSSSTSSSTNSFWTSHDRTGLQNDQQHGENNGILVNQSRWSRVCFRKQGFFSELHLMLTPCTPRLNRFSSYGSSVPSRKSEKDYVLFFTKGDYGFPTISSSIRAASCFRKQGFFSELHLMLTPCTPRLNRFSSYGSSVPSRKSEKDYVLFFTKGDYGFPTISSSIRAASCFRKQGFFSELHLMLTPCTPRRNRFSSYGFKAPSRKSENDRVLFLTKVNYDFPMREEAVRRVSKTRIFFRRVQPLTGTFLSPERFP